MSIKQSKKREKVESQINQVCSELSDLSAQKDDKTQQLTSLRTEFNQLEERLSERTNGASLERVGACVRPGVNEANLSPAERETFNAARNAVDTTTAACNELDDLIEYKKRVLANLEKEKSAIVCSSAADEMISFQDRVKQLKDEITTLREAITSQEEIISAAQSTIPLERDFLTKRAEILADIALNKTTSDDLDSIDKQIKEHESELSDAKNKVKLTIATANQTITGLRTKLDTTEEQLKGLESRKNNIVHEFLISEAEKIGEEYRQAFNNLEACFRRLVALERILKGKGHMGITMGYADRMFIPGFRLKSLEDKHSKGLGGLTFINTASGHHYNHLQRDITAEVSRWNTAGIEI